MTRKKQAEKILTYEARRRKAVKNDLYDAALNNDHRKLSTLLKKYKAEGTLPNYINKLGFDINEFEKKIRKGWKKGATPDVLFATPLRIACQMDHEECALLLLKFGAMADDRKKFENTYKRDERSIEMNDLYCYIMVSNPQKKHESMPLRYHPEALAGHEYHGYPWGRYRDSNCYKKSPIYHAIDHNNLDLIFALLEADKKCKSPSLFEGLVTDLMFSLEHDQAIRAGHLLDIIIKAPENVIPYIPNLVDFRSQIDHLYNSSKKFQKKFFINAILEFAKKCKSEESVNLIQGKFRWNRRSALVKLRDQRRNAVDMNTVQTQTHNSTTTQAAHLVGGAGSGVTSPSGDMPLHRMWLAMAKDDSNSSSHPVEQKQTAATAVRYKR